MSVSPVRSASAEWLSPLPATDDLAGELPQQLNSVDDILVGNWGQALLGILNAEAIANEERITTNITADEINRMFSFDANIDQACKASYAQAIVNLCALPTGRALIKKIIEKCHENAAATPQANPWKIEFINNGEVSQFIPEYKPLRTNEKRICSINLKWDTTLGCHAREDWVLLSKDQGGNLAFVNAIVPPGIVLAHELGHFLWALTVKHDAEILFKSLYSKIQKLAKVEYCKIFPVLASTKKKNTPAKKLFIDCWNHANYAEVLNILPLGSIPSASNFVDLTYSDGIFIGEAVNGTWNANDKPQFTNLAGDDITVNCGNLHSENWIRFSHSFSFDFYEKLRKLTRTAKEQFNALVIELLAKISKREGGFLQVSDLPDIT
ncbi:MAG: hypothetical protein LBI81_03860 [Puniceicoccales bacterium]|nr:hypothetical protein [Puniceicoccales bacterium]